jgi:dipeptidase E
MVRLLLTSGGIKNPSIHNALVELLGKPIVECNALCITTASYGHPYAGPPRAWSFIAGQEEHAMTALGWKSVGVLELTALPSLGKERWLPWIQAADALLVNGGDAMFLCHWMRESGLAELLPTLPNLVWAGLSAGSMVMTPRIGKIFVNWPLAEEGDDETLGVVDFSIFPHLDHPDLKWNIMANAEKWFADIAGPAYVIDDETAITVVDGNVEVISEGHWHLLKH